MKVFSYLCKPKQTFTIKNKDMKFKYILLILTLSVHAISISCQEIPEARYPGRRDIQSGNFDKIEQKILSKLGKDSSAVDYHYAAYQLYSAAAFQRRNVDLAYQHLTTARYIYIHSTPRQVERMAREGYDGTLFDYDFRRIAGLALTEARTRGTLDAYNHLIATYTQIPEEVTVTATFSRDSLELVQAQLQGTTEGFQEFLDRRPASAFLAQGILLRDSAAFADAQRLHTPEGYETFLARYPQSRELKEATDSLYSVAFHQTEQTEGEQLYRSFAERYPEAPQAPLAIFRADSIQYLTMTDTADWQSFILYLDHPDVHPGPWRTHALHTLATLVLAKGEIAPVVQALAHTPEADTMYLPLATSLRRAYLLPSVRNFNKLYNTHGHLLPLSWREQDSLALSAWQNYDYQILDSCIRAIAPYHEAYILLQQLIDHDLRYNRYKGALEKILPYRTAFEASPEYARLYATLADTTPLPNCQLTTLPAAVNAPRAEQHSPVVTADGRRLYFASRNRTDNIGGTDIYSSTRTKSKTWSNARIVMDLSHSYGNETPLSISPDGTRFLFLQNSRLFMAIRNANGWDMAKPLLPDFDLPVADACLSADGNALILSAPSHSATTPDTSLNLYVALLDANGQFGKPQDLGTAINTPFIDRAPFLHPDMQTLYFASEGHGALGQLDIFVARRLSPDRWDRWSEPKNIGRHINTVDNDAWLQVTTDGSTAYSHRRNAGGEIVSLVLPQEVRPKPVGTLAGTVKTQEGKAVATTLVVRDSASGEVLALFHSSPADGSYYITLPLGRKYSITVDDSPYTPATTVVDLTGSATLTYTYNFRLTPAEAD